MDEQPGIKRGLRRIFLKWVYSHIDIALYVGTMNKTYYLTHGLKNSQLIFAPHAIDNERFIYYKNENKRMELGIPGNAFVFLFVGKFESKKNPQLLIDSFFKINDNSVHLLMVGNGDLEKALRLKVNQTSNKQNNIHFLPFQNQQILPAIYRTADAVVLPSGGAW